LRADSQQICWSLQPFHLKLTFPQENPVDNEGSFGLCAKTDTMVCFLDGTEFRQMMLLMGEQLFSLEHQMFPYSDTSGWAESKKKNAFSDV
jgi:hypothetical protein